MTAEQPLRRGLITLSIMLATVMQALDTTIANVALPHMQGSLQASQDQITWVLTSYIVAAAITMPLTGWLCARFGRRRVFLVAVVGFTVASALCGMAMTLTQIVLARLLQGVFGASLIPMSQAVLLDINPPSKVTQAMAIWGAGIMVGPILGPMLGGWITDQISWRWVFFINVPVGVLAFIGIARYMPENRPPTQPLDLLGFATLSLTIGLLQMFLDRGHQLDWFESAEIRLEAAGALVAFAYFVAHTWTARRNTFFNPALLRDRNFMSGMMLVFLTGLVMFATMALLPTFLQGLLGYSVLYTGEVTAPRGVGTMLAMMLVGPLTQGADPRKVIAVGLAITAYSIYQMTTWTLDMDSSLIIVSGFIQGVGLGITFVPTTAVTFATLPAHLRNDATPVYSLVRNIGGSIGVSVVQAQLAHSTVRAHAELAIDIHRANPALLSLAGTPLDPQSAGGLSLLQAEVQRQALMMGYLHDFELMMWLTLATIPLLMLVRRPQQATDARPAAAEAH